MALKLLGEQRPCDHKWPLTTEIILYRKLEKITILFFWCRFTLFVSTHMSLH